MVRVKTIAVAWSALPPYAAYCLGRAFKRPELSKATISVISTHMDIPHVGIEEKLGRSMLYINASSPTSWAALGLPVPDVYFQSGWSRPALNQLGEEVRNKGGRVVIMVDNDWSGSLRQRIGGLYFRFFKRANYHSIFIPGQAGMPLACYLGFKPERCHTGLYGANPEIFYSETCLTKRPKQLLFVGRLNERKRVLDIIKAVEHLGARLDGWTIKLIGAGDLRDACMESERVVVAPFGDTNTVAQEMRESRALLLPSRKEHWGVVVHEAALSGCGLILSSAVGAADDLLGKFNGFSHKPEDYKQLAEAIQKFIGLDNDGFARAQNESLELASQFGPDVFAAAFAAALSS